MKLAAVVALLLVLVNAIFEQIVILINVRMVEYFRALEGQMKSGQMKSAQIQAILKVFLIAFLTREILAMDQTSDFLQIRRKRHVLKAAINATTALVFLSTPPR